MFAHKYTLQRLPLHYLFFMAIRQNKKRQFMRLPELILNFWHILWDSDIPLGIKIITEKNNATFSFSISHPDLTMTKEK